MLGSEDFINVMKKELAGNIGKKGGFDVSKIQVKYKYNLQFFASERGSNTDIPWSSGAVSDAAKQLESGSKSVIVKNRSQVEELFLGLYQGKGYVNVTGMDAMDARNLLGGKGNTYHWDDIFGSDGYLVGHGAGNLDAQMPHLQIHPQKGSVIRIFFDNAGGN